MPKINTKWLIIITITVTIVAVYLVFFIHPTFPKINYSFFLMACYHRYYLYVQYNCCGIDGPNDWLTHNTLLSHRPPLGPASCCAESADSVVVGGASRCVRVFGSGCHGHLVAYEDRQYSIMGPIGLAFGIFQVRVRAHITSNIERWNGNRIWE